VRSEAHLPRSRPCTRQRPRRPLLDERDHDTVGVAHVHARSAARNTLAQRDERNHCGKRDQERYLGGWDPAVRRLPRARQGAQPGVPIPTRVRVAGQAARERRLNSGHQRKQRPDGKLYKRDRGTCSALLACRERAANRYSASASSPGQAKRSLGQSCVHRCQCAEQHTRICRKFRADDGTRTHDLLHGKQTL
jgi:hypothetical protein